MSNPLATQYRRPQSARFLVLVLLALSVGFFSTAPAAGEQCEAEYQVVLVELQDDRMHRGSSQRLENATNNAWRMFNRDQIGSAVHQIDVALGQLEGMPAKHVPDDIRGTLIALLLVFRACIERGEIGVTDVVITTAYMVADPDVSDQPTGAGVHIRIDGETLAITGEDSTASFVAPSGTHEITAVEPSMAIGRKSVELVAGETKEITIRLDSDKEVIERTELSLVQKEEGVVDAEFDEFVLRFLQEGETVPLSRVDYIDILAPEGGQPTRIDGLFELEDNGSLVAQNVEELRALLLERADEQIEIYAQAYDPEGFTHGGTVRFHLGQFRIER